MGLTIHYSLKSDTDSSTRARQLVEQLRQAALDLAMTEVSEVMEFSGADCDTETRRQTGREQWLLIQARRMLQIGEGYYFATPNHVIAFSAWPGEECEVANFGLALYPEMIETKDGTLSTGVCGWRWHSFCKTQYASNQNAGGIANFVRCHFTVIRLLDVAKDIGILDEVKDEGKFWENREVKALVETVGQWNRHIAGIVGQFKDHFGGQTIAPITDYPNFEHLEAEGRKEEEDDSPS